MTEAHRVKVKRDGPRGWHWVAAESFDPARHELVDAPAPDAVAPATPTPAPAAPAAPQHTKGGRRAASKE